MPVLSSLISVSEQLRTYWQVFTLSYTRFGSTKRFACNSRKTRPFVSLIMLQEGKHRRTNELKPINTTVDWCVSVINIHVTKQWHWILLCQYRIRWSIHDWMKVINYECGVLSIHLNAWKHKLLKRGCEVTWEAREWNSAVGLQKMFQTRQEQI